LIAALSPFSKRRHRAIRADDRIVGAARAVWWSARKRGSTMAVTSKLVHHRFI